MAKFSAHVLDMPLRTYQAGWANHVLRAACEHRSEIIAVEMSRQSGKNETAAHVEAAILARMSRNGGDIVKTAPTWKPQIVNSKRRLLARANQTQKRLPFLKFQPREGYILECGNASIHFLSAAPTASVVGATASLLLEVDEAQDVDKDKFDKDFSPMRASTGAPVLATGTTWTDDTLLARFIREIEEGRVAGHHYRVPWDVVAEEVPSYGDFVEGEIRRLGEDHPLIRTQYMLLPLQGSGRMLSDQQLRLIVGRHGRQAMRRNEVQIVAGIDFAGADENAGDAEALLTGSSRDSVALTIGAMRWVRVAEGIIEPRIEILDRYEWVNQRADSLHSLLVEILGGRWRVDRVHCDATGIGEVSTAFLAKALPAGVCRGVKFDAMWGTQTRLAFQYIAQINRGHLIDYAPGFDVIDVARRDVPDAGNATKHAWWQRGHARLEAKLSQRVRAYVPESEGHDDLLMSEELMVDAAYGIGRPIDVEHTAGVSYRQY